MKSGWVGALFSLCAMSVAALPAVHAQTSTWPKKPVRFVIASPTGSGDDMVARIIAPKLSELLGQNLVVDNRGGAAGLIGQRLALNATPDGYTFLLAGGSMAGAPYANAHATYDVLRDFTPVSLVETGPFVLVVSPTAAAKTVKELIGLARSRPGKMTYGTPGPGQIPYWSARLFNSMAGIEATEVPYKGTAEIAVGVIGGETDYFFAPAGFAHNPKLRALGVTTATRSPALPDLPPIAEVLPGYEMPAWRSIMGPAGIPQDIVRSFNAAIRRALSSPDVRDKLQAVGSEPTPSSPQELAKRYADWRERFGRIAKQAGLKPQ